MTQESLKIGGLPDPNQNDQPAYVLQHAGEAASDDPYSDNTARLADRAQRADAGNTQTFDQQKFTPPPDMTLAANPPKPRTVAGPRRHKPVELNIVNPHPVYKPEDDHRTTDPTMSDAFLAARGIIDKQSPRT